MALIWVPNEWDLYPASLGNERLDGCPGSRLPECLFARLLGSGSEVGGSEWVREFVCCSRVPAEGYVVMRQCDGMRVMVGYHSGSWELFSFLWHGVWLVFCWVGGFVASSCFLLCFWRTGLVLYGFACCMS